MSVEEKSKAALDRALEDAILYGAGWMVIRPNGEIQHLRPEKYLEAAEVLQWAHARIEALPKE